MNNRPKVWVWVVIIKNNKVLLWKRKNAHWDWDWSFSGGHLEYSESRDECAICETKEEVGISIKNITFWTITNDIFNNENKHYITIIMLSEYDKWEVKNIEPDKCERWEWFKWEELPKNLFLPIQNLKKQWFNPIKNETK